MFCHEFFLPLGFCFLWSVAPSPFLLASFACTRRVCALSSSGRVKQETVHFIRLNSSFLAPFSHNIIQFFRLFFLSLSRQSVTLFRKIRRLYVKVSLFLTHSLIRWNYIDVLVARYGGQAFYDRSIAKCLNDSTVNTVGLMPATRSPGP